MVLINRSKYEHMLRDDFSFPRGSVARVSLSSPNQSALAARHFSSPQPGSRKSHLDKDLANVTPAFVTPKSPRTP